MKLAGGRGSGVGRELRQIRQPLVLLPLAKARNPPVRRGAPVRGTAGGYQVDGAKVALGHAYGGAAQYFAMWIVASDPEPKYR